MASGSASISSGTTPTPATSPSVWTTTATHAPSSWYPTPLWSPPTDGLGNHAGDAAALEGRLAARHRSRPARAGGHLSQPRDRHLPHRLPPRPTGSTSPPTRAAGATEWLPSIHVGNPISSPSRTDPVEKAIAYEFTTTTTAATQDATGRGARTTGWRVIITKPLAASDDGEFAIPTGTISTVAFAARSGAAHDAGSRQMPRPHRPRPQRGELTCLLPSQLRRDR